MTGGKRTNQAGFDFFEQGKWLQISQIREASHDSMIPNFVENDELDCDNIPNINTFLDQAFVRTRHDSNVAGRLVPQS